jgi:hypothetical protein
VPDRPVKYADRPVKYADRPTLYSDCLALYVDSLNGLSRVCTVCGGLGAGLGNSLLKMGSDAAGPDGPRSRADGPDMHRSANLSPMCVEAVVAQGTCLSVSHKGVVTGRDNL